MPNIDTIEGEIWKDIEDWPYHQVSNKGRVRALPGARVQRRLILKTELRKLTSNKSGYITIAKNKQNIYVHTIVLNTFDGPCPYGHECRHFNNNPSDNRWPENLVWGTRHENIQDRYQIK